MTMVPMSKQAEQDPVLKAYFKLGNMPTSNLVIEYIGIIPRSEG
eukprot:14808.XXX_720475_720606_1 [CDS] Oithona nana genome sequencing.